jgi:transcriptional regulator with XRE-family HTH domain
MENVREILAKNIRLARQAARLSQEDLADRSGIDRTYVSGIEREVRNPTIGVVAKFAAALDTTTANLLTDGAYHAEQNSGTALPVANK